MRRLAMAMSVSLGLGQALACGTHPAQEQAKIDAQELGKLQGLVRDSAFSASPPRARRRQAR